MHEIYFPGRRQELLQASYALLSSVSPFVGQVVIFVRQYISVSWTSLFNTDVGRDILLNRIFNKDLSDVDPKSVRFIVSLEMDRLRGGLEAALLEFKIVAAPLNHLAPEHELLLRQKALFLTRAKSKPHHSHEKVRFLSQSVIASPVRVKTNFDDSVKVCPQVAIELYTTLGLSIPDNLCARHQNEPLLALASA